ncbi:hypothetical protein CP8484711_0977A, partial [Chlamydia psittaci 84-8471/1]
MTERNEKTSLFDGQSFSSHKEGGVCARVAHYLFLG